MSRIASVNVGRPREVEYRGRRVSTGIYKSPVDGPVRIEGVNLVGDDQADRSVHGGFDKAVYAYGCEDYAWWSEELNRSLSPGTFGENLTTAGIDLRTAVVGQRWTIGQVELEVSEPRMPCYKLGIRMDDSTFPRRFSAADRPGTYLRIIGEGTITAGDSVEVAEPPSHAVTVGDIARTYSRDRHQAGLLLGVDQLSESWKAWAHQHAPDQTGEGSRS